MSKFKLYYDAPKHHRFNQQFWSMEIMTNDNSYGFLENGNVITIENWRMNRGKLDSVFCSHKYNIHSKKAFVRWINKHWTELPIGAELTLVNRFQTNKYNFNITVTKTK